MKLAALLLVAALSAISVDCGSPPTPLSPTTLTKFVDAGCDLVAIAAPAGSPAVTYCKGVAYIVAPIATEVVNRVIAANAAGAPTVAVAQLTHGGGIVGYARTDLLVSSGRSVHDEIQAKLDALK